MALETAKLSAVYMEAFGLMVVASAISIGVQTMDDATEVPLLVLLPSVKILIKLPSPNIE